MKRYAAWWVLTVAGPALGASGPLPCNESDVNGQLSLQAGHGSGSLVGVVSDANPAARPAVRDNFIIDAGGSINTVSWRGLYVDFDTPERQRAVADRRDRAAAVNAPPPGPSIIHLSQPSFDAAVLAACKTSFTWDFTPNNLPPGGIVGLDDPLDITTHADNPNDPWGDLWPPEVDNVQFSSNMNPAGPLEPRIVEGLAFVGAGVLNLTNDLLAANVFTDSFNVVSGPRGATRVAMSMELVSLSTAGVPTAVVFRVTVFDSMGAELAAIEIPAMAADQVFLGVIPEEGDTIGRIDVWDMLGNDIDSGAEGIATITTYFCATCLRDCGDGDGNVGINDFLAMLAQWGTAGTCDFDGGNVGISDFLDLLAHWGRCP